MRSPLHSRPIRQPTEGTKRVQPQAMSNEAPSGSIAAEINALLTLTISSVAFATSFAVLIFSGGLQSGMPRAIGTFLVGGGVMAVLVAWRSQIQPVATLIQGGPAILMAGVAASFIARDGTEVADVFVLLVVTMLVTSLATWLLGHFGLGGLGRRLPKPVVDAFVGGIGWLLLKGGFSVMTNSTVGLADLRGLFEFETAKYWAPGFAIGLVAWLANRSHRVPNYVSGLVLCTCLVGFYAVVARTSSFSVVESGGWLLGPFPETASTRMVTPSEFANADWTSIARTTPGILSVAGVACITHMFNLAGIRSKLAPRLDVDAELRTSAGVNVAAGLFGVTPGFQALAYTMVLHQMGGTRRITPMISGGLVLVFGIIGVTAVGYVPRLIFGALWVMIGLAMLDNWIGGLLRSTSATEKLLGLLIGGAVAWFGLLPGLGVGLAAAGVAFIVSYSRVDPVRRMSAGHQLCNRVARLPNGTERRRALGDHLIVLELQGYLFFGSLISLEDRLREVTLGPAVVEAVVIDFTRVTGVDSSGCAVVARLLEELRVEGIGIWVSAADPAPIEALLASQPELARHAIFSDSLDAALDDAETSAAIAELMDAPIPDARSEPDYPTLVESSVRPLCDLPFTLRPASRFEWTRAGN